MFELLFKYPFTVWQDATLVFDSGWPVPGLVLAIVIALALLFATLTKLSLSRSRRVGIAALQGLVASMVLVMLWQPALLVAVSERGENTVAWVVDVSNSMQRNDAFNTTDDSVSRIEAAVQAVQSTAMADDTDFAAALYTSGTELNSVTRDQLLSLSPDTLSTRSNLAPGLDALLGTVSDTALAAVVLVSDGADNSDAIDPAWWQSLSAAGVPVHTVGVGQVRDPEDIELVDVSMPQQVQPDTQVSARLRIRHAREGVARVRVMAGEELLAAEDVTLVADVEQTIHTIRFSSGDRGIRQLEFVIEPPADSVELAPAADPLPGNNRQPRILQVIDAPRRILYVEGEPRWEYKFLRRALDQHPGITVVSLLRTSPNKFYRQGVQDASELANGFPDSREQLFSYDAVIIGSLEAAELSTPQQSALRDFVSERGGSLLMLAGRHGLADGGWGRSVVAAALPVVLNNRLSSETFTRTRTRAIPTLAGLRTPWLQLADNDAANLSVWQGLPDMADVQSVGQPKPGAVVLLERQSTDLGVNRADPLLVMQRYGRGSSVVLGTSGTWRWQMGMPVEDQSHERFWRQLLGMLVEQSVPRIAIDLANPVVRDATSATLSVNAYNADYTDLQQAILPVRLTRPDGSISTVQLYADNEQPGRYSGQVPVDSDGPFSVTAASPLDGESPSQAPVTAEQWWVGETDSAEQFNAQLNQDFLRRVADTTGGSYLAVADAAELNSVLARENAALKRESRLPLWNMPFFFVCLFLLKALEWALRLRWKRL